MSPKEKTIQLLQEKRSYLQSKFSVSKIGVFGSVAKGHSSESSDVDILVEFDHPVGFQFIELADYLESLLGRKVDILTSAGIETIQSKHVVDSIREGVIYVETNGNGIFF